MVFTGFIAGHGYFGGYLSKVGTQKSAIQLALRMCFFKKSGIFSATLRRLQSTTEKVEWIE